MAAFQTLLLAALVALCAGAPALEPAAVNNTAVEPSAEASSAAPFDWRVFVPAFVRTRIDATSTTTAAPGAVAAADPATVTAAPISAVPEASATTQSSAPFDWTVFVPSFVKTLPTASAAPVPAAGPWGGNPWARGGAPWAAGPPAGNPYAGPYGGPYGGSPWTGAPPAGSPWAGGPSGGKVIGGRPLGGKPFGPPAFVTASRPVVGAAYGVPSSLVTGPPPYVAHPGNGALPFNPYVPAWGAYNPWAAPWSTYRPAWAGPPAVPQPTANGAPAV